MMANAPDIAKQVLLLHLDALRIGGDQVLKLGANLTPDRAELQQDDVVAVAVQVEADALQFFGSSRIGAGVAEIQVISSTAIGAAMLADTLMALHGWTQPGGFPADGATLPEGYPAPAELRDVIRGMFLRRTRTDEDDETGAVMRSYQYRLIFS